MAFHHLLFCLDPPHLFLCCIRGNKSNIRNIHNDTPNHHRHICISFECQNRNIPILPRNVCKWFGIVAGCRLLLLPCYTSYMSFITEKKPTFAITTKKRYQSNSNVLIHAL